MSDDSRILEDAIPASWAYGLVRLCGVEPHTHGVRQKDGSWKQQPCPTPGKRPTDTGFNKVAETRWKTGGDPTPHVVLSQRALDEGYNLGLVPPPGLIVIDCDTAATVDWLDELAPAGTPVMKRTERSAHYYFRVPIDIGELKAKRIAWANSDEETFAMDLRVAGKSQAVVPPSRHASGEHYRWLTPLPDDPADVPYLPPQLEEVLKAHHAPTAAERRNPDEIPGHDRIRSFVNRWCRYATTKEEVRVRAMAYADKVYADRPERRDEACAEGGEVDRLIDSGWDRYGGAAPLDQDRTDQGYADHFAASNEDWIYDPVSKVWYHHNDGLWSQRDATWLRREVGRLNDKLLEDAVEEIVDAARRERLMLMHRQLRMTNKVTAVVRRLEANSAFEVSRLDHDANLLLMGDDGHGVRQVFELNTLNLRDAAFEDYMTRQMGAGFVVTEEWIRHKWEQFLVDTFPDPDVRAYVHRAVGMTVLGQSKEHAIFFLYGRGGSGKSTFLNALLAAFGSYAVKSGFATFVGDKALNDSAPTPDIARLRGVRLVVCSEIPDKARLGARMKDLTGGDRLVGRELYGKPFEFEPRFTAWVAGNVPPEADFLDSGIERRLRVVPADHACAQPNPALLAIFSSPAGRAVVVDWVIRGLQAYQQNGGLGSCAAVRQAQTEYWAALNPVEEWFRGAYRVGPGEVSSTELYHEFLVWMEDTHGLKASNSAVPNARKFGKAIARLGPSAAKTTGGKRVWRGLSPIERSGVKTRNKSVKLPNLQEE